MLGWFLREVSAGCDKMPDVQERYQTLRETQERADEDYRRGRVEAEVIPTADPEAYPELAELAPGLIGVDAGPPGFWDHWREFCEALANAMTDLEAVRTRHEAVGEWLVDHQRATLDSISRVKHHMPKEQLQESITKRTLEWDQDEAAPSVPLRAAGRAG